MTIRYVRTCDQCKKEIAPGWYAYRLHGGQTELENGIYLHTYGMPETDSDFCSFTCLTDWVSDSQRRQK